MAEQRITETIEFLTQIHTSWDNTEQRMALRSYPRRSVSYRYTGVDTAMSEYLRSLTNGLQTQQLEFPLWSATRTLPKTRRKKETGIQLTAQDVWDYRDCHAVLLTKEFQEARGNSTRYFLKQLYSSGYLQMKTTFKDDYYEGATLVTPVFWGILNQEDSYTNVTASLADMCINVEFMPSLTAVNLPAECDEYNYPFLTFAESTNALNNYKYIDDYELFMMPPSWYQDMNMSYSRNANKLDNQTGYFRYDLKSKATTTHMVFDYHAKSKDEIQFLQRFFYRCKGQWKSFYVPTWTSDIELVKDGITTKQELIAKFPYYYRYYNGNQRRKTIIIFFNNGTVKILKIVGWELDSSGKHSKITLESPLTEPIYMKDVRMISFLLKVRHASDSMVTEYETRESANISFELMEVDN
nr:MAG TPA: protein of unknown function DUF2460 [Caudoviricetes sp.]